MPTQPGFRYRRSAVTEARHGQDRVVAVRRRPRRKLIGVLIVILLLVPAGLLAAKSLYGTMSGTVADPEIAAESPGPTAPPLDPNNPFDGTPANTYVAPEQGIEVPTPTKTGSWAAKDVATVLEKTKAVLIAARTDQAVLGGDSADYVKALAPNVRSQVKKAIVGGTDTLGYVTNLAATYTLAQPIRAAGSLTVTTGALKQLIVRADVVWIYPLAGPLPAQSKGAGVRLVVLHTVESYEWFPSKGFADEDQGARPGEGERAVFNADCPKYLKGALALPSTPVTDPVKGNEKVFTVTTPLTSFPTGC
ncbi:hypothetical protein [Cryptosporangium phraense]|uniref:Uncharacterized protein n=1 Tax=Cryptosporangium phraense TaxID=2593070 RepID=A0A545AU10_9ACTN|nr:hypothetical protein [Cryptosporangium phraense]TQS44829.1 hypothetical protein FL583_12810 [Cryptosporangium phraense]